MKICRIAFATLCCVGLAALGEVSQLAAAELAVVADTVRVAPEQVTLNLRRRPHSLLVMGRTADGIDVDLTTGAKYEVADPEIARVDALGWVHGLKSGKTEVLVSAASQQLKVPVACELPDAEAPYSFLQDVMPVLSKAGCNMGACHGYSLGKNGFHLSLRGADPALDFGAITDEFYGRRINIHQPAASLLIQKPLGQVPHKGGVRFEPDSLQHQLLLGWIEQGAAGDVETAPKVASIRIAPEQAVLYPEMQHQLQLIATMSDGSERDVTHLGIFTVNTESVAKASEEGLVETLDLGETAVVARYERLFAVSNIIVLPRETSFTPNPVPEDHLIDLHVSRKLNELKIDPSPLADDAQFLRRVYLDLIGLQPTPDEIRTFVADENPSKRADVVDVLFARSEFVDHWSMKWGDLLQNSRLFLTDESTYAFREWIRHMVASNTPMDEMVRKLLTSQGGVDQDPAGAYFAISADTDETIQRATQVFCGVRMLCAKCHPHPFENWTQADYYGLHSFFNQVTVKADPRRPGVRNAKSVVINAAANYSRNPRTGQLQPPRFLGGEEPEVAADVDRRQQYAAWLTSPDNPFFARSMVNRYWSYFFSRGIIDPVDDLRTTNPPINPGLLSALTEDFVEHKFDVRQLMRRIVTSRTYQRSSTPTATNAHDVLNFSHCLPRRVGAEALLDSLVQATAVPERFSGAPAGFTAAQLPDATVNSEFLNLFGKPQRMEACECERDDGSNMLQALHFINGPSIISRVTNGSGRIAQLLKAHGDDDALVTELYLWTVARFPSEAELDLAAKHFRAYGEKRAEAAQDLAWALLNSKDFLLVH